MRNVWCLMCNGYYENIVHILWLCDVTKEVWRNSIFFDIMNQCITRSFGDVFNSIWTICISEELVILAICVGLFSTIGIRCGKKSKG